MVVSYSVIWVSYPECSWRDVIIKQTRTHSHKNGEIILPNIPIFDSVFMEKCSTHDVEDDRVFNQDVLGAVHVDGAIEALMNAAAADIRSLHVAQEMEVYWIPTKPEVDENNGYTTNRIFTQMDLPF